MPPLRRILAATAALTLAATAALASPEFWRTEWPDTDFGTTSVENWREIMSGGPPKDGIPALSDPDFIDVAQETRLGDREPVIAVEIDGATPRAYPIRYLTWHEIVNDTVGGIPVAVTFCPLCNSGLTFDRRVQGGVLTFGVSGKLRASDMVMYDRETQSWWQQALGEGIVGEMTGVRLTQMPTWMESWAEFRDRNPQGLVMDEPAWPRAYGSNPYVRYDSSRQPFLYNGEMPPHGIQPLERVVRVGDRAWPVSRLRETPVVTEAGVTLSWTSGQASALDSRDIGQGRDVGTIRVRDAQGRDVPHDVLFAFAFHAFWPEGTWMLGG
ncbi:DUF3179 domain-containing protein [Rhodobacteraceae bacterium CCMM004]|nr:DUF3179 domain-containing protein [Rhodobacteraceae bacterium CCMM004]